MSNTMREILYRGQTRRYGERIKNPAGDKMPSNWVYGGIFQGPNKSIIYSYEPVEKHVVYSDTVGAYTGLTDKNGTKIFEGDIIKTKKYGKIEGRSNVNNYDIFVVVYEPAVFRLVNHSRGFNLVGKATDYEVIGNIHDNPDLLKGA